jgi:predicted N-acetyltransferase YhbS
MSVFRSARPEEIETLVALSDRTFRKPGQTSMGAAYSMLFAETNADNLLVAEEDGNLVTLVGLLPAKLSVAGCTISAVSMGSVCTDADYRGQNFADTLVKQSIAKCSEEGVHLLLVSGSRSLYLRNDCLEVGAIKRFSIRCAEQLEGLNVPSHDHAVIRPFEAERDLSPMLKLMQSEQVYYHRTAEELKQLINNAAVISNDKGEQSVLISCDENGEPIGYLVFGILKKEEGAVIEVVEFAGSDEAVIGLLGEVWASHSPQRIHITVTNDRPALAEKLAAIGSSFKEIPIQGTIRMINFSGLWNSLQSYMERQLGKDKWSELSLTETGNAYRIHFREESFTVDHRGATRLVFNGPQLAVNGPLKAALSELFPLPFVYTKNLNYV